MNSFIEKTRISGDLVYNFIEQRINLGENYELARFVISNKIEHLKFSKEYFIFTEKTFIDNFTTIMEIDNFIIYKRIEPHIISFDIFDTLIARKCIFPENIFNIIAEKSKIPNFKELRIKAESLSDGTFDNIYNKFKNLSNLSDEEILKLKDIEIETELENIFPIVENRLKLRPQDILVSDMYLSRDTIIKLLQKCGYSGDNKLYLSSNGKKKGIIWNQIKENFSYHIGDNYNSDVISAFLWGNKKGILYSNSGLTEMEKFLISANNEAIAKLIRQTRLLNMYDTEPFKSLYNEQVNKNLPILILYSIFINRVCIENNYDTILFSTRDCCLLKQVFEQLFPNYKIIKFHSSRLIYKNPSKDYVEYVKSVYHNKSIIIDLQGSGNSVQAFFDNNMNIKLNIIYLILFIKQDNFNYVINDMRGDNIENINYDIEGTLLDFTNNSPIRDNLEYSVEFIKPSHEAIKIACENIKSYNIHLNQNKDEIIKILDILLFKLKDNLLLNNYVIHKQYHN